MVASDWLSEIVEAANRQGRFFQPHRTHQSPKGCLMLRADDRGYLCWEAWIFGPVMRLTLAEWDYVARQWVEVSSARDRADDWLIDAKEILGELVEAKRD